MNEPLMHESMPRLLLAEDDPVSREYLQAALQSLPLSIQAEDRGDLAFDAARNECFDLLVLDRNLPGMNAEEILERLRGDRRAASHASPALALSAEVDPATVSIFRDHGFADLLAKPIDRSTLRRAVLRLLPPLPLWRDREALDAVNGHADVLARLRELMLTDLPAQNREIQSALQSGDVEKAHALLHRLRSACGFCGAARLAEAVDALDRRILQAESSHVEIDRARLEFETEATALLQAGQPTGPD